MRTANSLIGNPIERIEDLRFLRGRGEYVDDVARPDVLHAAILRSSVAHGRIIKIDATEALRRAGVRAVFTAADVERELGYVPIITLRQELLEDFKRYQQPVIASNTVRYVGEPLAVVVAEGSAIAEDALEAIRVDIEPLPVVADRDAARHGDVLLFEEAATNLAAKLTGIRGDTNAAFARAPYVRRERFKVQRFTAVPMEPRGLLATWDAKEGHLTVYGTAKVTFHNRIILAKHLKLAEEAITLIEQDVGGGFGVRGEYYPEDFLIPFAARNLACGIKWIEDRREHLLATNHARDAECQLEIACELDGSILGLRGAAAVDLGAYLRTNGATAARNIAQVISGPYRIPNVKLEVELLMTNKTPSGTYRGPGRFEADFFRERLFDMAARDLQIDRVEFRRRNLISESEMPWALPTVLPLNVSTETDNGDYRATLERCLQEFKWAEKESLQGRFIKGRYHGLGIGCYLEGGGSGPRENARLVLERDGSVSVYVGSSALGQGIETIFTQIAADALQIPPHRIRGVFHGSTVHVGRGYGSYSSRSTVMGGSAIVAAAENLRIAIRNSAAKRLKCSDADIALTEDEALGPEGRRIAISELALDDLSAEGTYSSKARTYSYGAHAAYVTVDPKTGGVELLDYVAVEDVGRIINPATLHGQTLGAIVQGLGGALLEELIYDNEGQLLTGSFADYLLPIAGNFPVIRAIGLELRPAPHNPLGAKGAGEGGIIPVGGVIANAIANALYSLGVEPHELPLSPPRLWTLIAQGAHYVNS